MWRPSSFGYSFSSQIRKLPPLLLLFSAKLSSCTHYVRTSLYLPRFGSAQLSPDPPLFLTPNSTSPFRARCLYFWVAIFPSPKSGHPHSVCLPHFPVNFPLLPHAAKHNSPLPPHFVYSLRLLQTSRQADLEGTVAKVARWGGIAHNKSGNPHRKLGRLELAQFLHLDNYMEF